NDRYEQEADSVADRIVRQPTAAYSPSKSPAHSIHRKQASRAGHVTTKSPSKSSIVPRHSSIPLVQAEFESNEAESVQPKSYDTVRRSGGDDGDSPAPSGFAQALSSHGGSGSPIPDTNRSQMEPTLGDLSGVRVHTDSQAAQMSQDIGAKAFTHGNDIYFNQGQYQPGTSEGQHLLAHEATHTVQQTGGVQSKRIQREEEGDGGGEKPEMTLETGKLEPDKGELHFDKLVVPGFKHKGHRKSLYDGNLIFRNKSYNRDDVDQRVKWQNNLSNASPIQNKITEGYKESHNGVGPKSGEKIIAKVNLNNRKKPYMLIGTHNTVAKELSTPNWSRSGKFNLYHVDHMVELQVSGWPDKPFGDAMSNYELLDGDHNVKSGDKIKSYIIGKIGSFIKKHGQQYPGSVSDFKKNYNIHFEEVVGEEGSTGPFSEEDYWTKDEIAAGNHLNNVSIGDMSDLGEKGKIQVFPRSLGGISKEFAWDGQTTDTKGSEKDWFKSPFVIKSKQFHTSDEDVAKKRDLGTLTVGLNKKAEETLKMPAGEEVIEVKRMNNAPYAGYISKKSFISKFSKMELVGLSPLEVTQFDVTEEGLMVNGNILPSVPLFQGSPVEFRLFQGDLEIRKTFALNEINIPPPFKITNSSLTVFASMGSGVGLEGETNFGINQVGEGYLKARVSTSESPELEGEFSFDSKLFNPAKIKAAYKENTFTVGGEIGIGAGTIKGVKSATITAEYTEGGPFKASGTAQLDIPGVEQGNMEVTMGEDVFEIGGDFTLTKDVPGIDSGQIAAKLTKDKEGNWHVEASGTAKPSIPGIDTTVNVTYNDGIFDINAKAGYERGMLGGTIHFGVTNRG
ncbi:MAG TPA: hypothetical protein DCP28_18000, partial [Cytophagales bacterium]|nr:hypothetical protein [Cytophagales bacterium]